MSQRYLQRFTELFLSLTGIPVENATIGLFGWLFIPPEINLEEKSKHEREIIGALGWRNHLVNDEPAGWWVKPWPNIEEGKFIALTLSEYGAGSFAYLQNGASGQRHVYFVRHINTGAISGAPMLLGQFIFEFEGSAKIALEMRPGGTNRIYYPRDRRISSYDPLSEEEIQDTRARLNRLAEIYPAEVARLTKESVSGIERLLQSL